MSHQQTLIGSTNLRQQLLENVGSRVDLLLSQIKDKWDESDALLNSYVFHLSFVSVFGFLR